MKKLVATLLIASIGLPTVAWGDDKPVGSPAPAASSTSKTSADGPAIISPLQKGQPAPYPGILFSPRAAASVAADISGFPERLKIEVNTAVKKAEAGKDFVISENNSKCNADKTVLDAKIDANLKRINQLQIDLDAAKASTPNRTVWFSIGAVGGIALTLLTVFVVGQATK